MALVWERALADLRALHVETRESGFVTAAEAVAHGLSQIENGKSFGPRALSGHLGYNISNATLARVKVALAETTEPTPPPTPPPADAPPPPVEQVQRAEYEVNERTGTGTCELIVPEGMIQDEAGLLTFAGIDPERWEAHSMRVRAYGTAMKITDEDGSQRPVVIQMAAVKLDLRAKVLEPLLKALAADLIADIREEAKARTAPAPLRRRDPGPGHLLVLHAPDIHHGKVPVDGSAWDGPAAFTAAVDYLLGLAGWVDTGRVLITLGNDALNTDGSRRGTTKGTPQDGLGRWRQEFRAVAAMYRHAIDRALEVAPVSVVVVPGNHDRDACFYLGETIAAAYQDSPHVDVTNSHRPRTYHLHGRCLLGLTHGDGCKITDLPRLMSEEAAEMWAHAVCREWITGHRHRLEVQTVGSCKIRTSDALSPTEEWHDERGYTGVTRSGEALIYHPEAGRLGTLQAPLSALPLAA